MPVFARVYGIPPRDQPKLTLGQYRALQQDYHQMQKGGDDGSY